MSSIDERVVKMSFDNAKFEAGVTQTINSLKKLSDSLKTIGTTSGLGDIEKAANKINFQGLTSAIDSLKSKLAFSDGASGFKNIENEANKISFGPLGSAVEGIKSRLSSITDAPSRALDFFKEKLGFKGADAGLNNIEAASNKVKFEGPSNAADVLSRKLQHFPGATDGFNEIERASSKVHFSGITEALGSLTAHFSSLTVVATSALATISSKATSTGLQMAKSFTLGPIIDGFKEYATNLNSIQTILANTQASGAGLKDVNKALNELNHYSDLTIYNFSQMAKNIGTFTAAGVDLKTSTQAIKGIANLAALSGSNSEQASTAMYQLSQAIAAGRVSLQDWNSVVNAGMGGTVFQRALANTAQAMGTLKKGTVDLVGPMKNVSINGESFRESITAKPGQQSWLTSDVLTKTLSQFTGDLSDAQLAAMGFNDQQIKAIQQTAVTAKKAATEVKTISQVFDVAKEAIGSGWSATFQTIFGDFEEAKSLFTSVSTSINNFIGTNAKARNDVLADWKELGGRTELIKGIQNVFEDLKAAIAPIHDAFREIFPRKTGQDLFDLTERFVNFTDKLKMGPEIAHDVQRTFSGFFAVLDIGKQVVSGVVSVLGDLLGASASGSGGILNFTGTIGDFLVSVDKALKEGNRLSNFFDGLGHVLSVPIQLLSDLAGALGNLFSGEKDSGGISSSMDDMTASLNPLTMALHGVSAAWHGFLDVLSNVTDQIGPAVQEIGKSFGGVGEAIANAFANADYEKIFQIIQTTLIGGIFFAIKKGFSKGINFNIGGGVVKNLAGSLETLTGSLKSMQRGINAATLVEISAAIGVLAAGVLTLSTIDPKRLGSAMTAVAVGLGQLVAAMALLTKVGGAASFLTMPFIAASLILLAGAVDTLAIAMKIFSKMKWEELAKGLTGVGGALVALGIGVRAVGPSITLVAPGILAVAAAMNLLALAMKIFATMKWEEIAKGLVGVGGGLTAIGIGTKFIGPSILLIGPGLIATAAGLNLLALAVKGFGSMNLVTLAKGIGGIAASLVAIGLAIQTIPPTVALQAAGLVILGVALTEIAGAVALMGGMSMGKLAKGIGAIGASLVVLAAGLTLMTGTLPGAAALVAAATGLAILTPVLGILGNLKFSTIAKGLAVIGASIAVLALAGTFAAPGLTALGIAMIPLAAAAVLASSAVYLLASGLAKLGGEGSKGITAALVAMTAFVAAFPGLVINFLKGLVEILAQIAKIAPDIVDSMIKIVESLIDVVIEAAPKMAEAVVALIEAFLKVLNDTAPDIIDSGWKLLLNFLSGIANNIGKVTETVGQIILNFLTALASNIGQIVAAGANLLVKFLEGLISNFPKMIDAGARAIVSFLNGVATNIPDVVQAAVHLVAEFVRGIAENIGQVIRAGANLIIKILEGIGDNVKRVAKAATDMVSDFFDAAVKASLDLIDAGARAVLNFLNGVASAIRKYGPEFGKAGANIASAIIEGCLGGIDNLAGQIPSKLAGIAGDAIKSFGKKLGIGSPSKEFMKLGQYTMQGLVIGIDNSAPAVNRSLESSAEDMIDTMANTLRVVPDILDGLIDMDPVITPVLDLTSVEQGAKKLGDLSNVIPITAAASFIQAATISASQDQSQNVSEDTPVAPVTEVKFEQNNYSPEALSSLDIYRQTQNQLAQAKNALGLP